jgi:hypothetical protein
VSGRNGESDWLPATKGPGSITLSIRYVHATIENEKVVGKLLRKGMLNWIGMELLSLKKCFCSAGSLEISSEKVEETGQKLNNMEDIVQVWLLLEM